jgi:hypothetical protein
MSLPKDKRSIAHYPIFYEWIAGNRGPQQHGLTLAMTHIQLNNNLGWMWRYVATAEAEVCARRTGGGGNIDEREGDKGKITRSLGRQKSV